MICNSIPAKRFAVSLILLAWICANAAPAKEPQVVPGLEVLLTEQNALIAGKRAGLITNHSSVDRQLRHSIDLLTALPRAKLTALFAPEHGIRGMAQAGEKVGDGVDERSGIPVYSLYGEIRRPTPEMLKDVDVLIFDIQDVGVRFYTYTATLGECMEAAADRGIPFIVLDRPNVLADTRLEGRMLDMKFKSFVGAYPEPIRYGLTLGELAGFIKAGMKKEVNLIVVKMKNWRRNLWYDQTGLPWIPPSPNIPTVDTAMVYPGMCLIEGTNVSEGRGTTKPFEMIGAPWIDGFKLADELRSLKLEGVLFRPVSFTPTASKFSGQLCHGIQVHVTDRERFQSVQTAMCILRILRHSYPNQFQWRSAHFDRLAGSDDVRLAIDQNMPAEKIVATWEPELKAFAATRAKFLLYP